MIMTSSAIAIEPAEFASFFRFVDLSEPCFLAGMIILDLDSTGEYHGATSGLLVKEFTEGVLYFSIDGTPLHRVFSAVPQAACY